jgi:hypothetical protein
MIVAEATVVVRIKNVVRIEDIIHIMFIFADRIEDEEDSSDHTKKRIR